MKTIVYLADGSIECTARADEFVNAGIARYATAKECRYRDYERRFEVDDTRYEDMALYGDSGPSQPSYE